MSANEPATVHYSPPFQRVQQRLSLGQFDSVTATTSFSVLNSDVELVGDGFERLLGVEGTTAGVAVSTAGHETTYTVTVEAENHEEFAAAYAQWAPGGGFVATDDSSFIVVSTAYSFSPGLLSITGAHEVLEGTPTAVALPFGIWVDGGAATGAGFSADVAFDVEGVRPGGLLTGAGMLVVIAASLFVIVRNRHRIGVALAVVRATALGAVDSRVSPSEQWSLSLVRPTQRVFARRSLTQLSVPSRAAVRYSLVDLSTGRPVHSSVDLLTDTPSIPSPTARSSLIDYAKTGD
ncbi:hypothetical protein [Agrococcus jenensis]|uniref:Uncharacterized protein n=1 Tax=Agrococcus jenensis TaxID=46353 RepID=A0A3N2AQR7_9MICO|nr:hypothetical protein [Agrococcus jenensis]ROR65336.1 hypothetical protein EDD26_0702 [Agrococcus jenensis]